MVHSTLINDIREYVNSRSTMCNKIYILKHDNGFQNLHHIAWLQLIIKFLRAGVHKFRKLGRPGDYISFYGGALIFSIVGPRYETCLFHAWRPEF